ECHEMLVAVSVSIWDKGRPVDLVTVAEEINLRGQVENIGGYVYLGELWDAAPTAALAVHYARIVRDHSVARQLAFAGTEIVREATERAGASAEELLERAERKIFALAEVGLGGSALPVGEIVGETCDRLDARCKNGRRTTGVPTGFLDLDEATCGFQDSELVLLAARPCQGKT